MIRVESIWLACGVSDLRAGMDTLLARVVHKRAPNPSASTTNSTFNDDRDIAGQTPLRLGRDDPTRRRGQRGTTRSPRLPADRAYD